MHYSYSSRWLRGQWSRYWEGLSSSQRGGEAAYWALSVGLLTLVYALPRVYHGTLYATLYGGVAGSLSSALFFVYVLRLVSSVVYSWPLPVERLHGHVFASRRALMLGVALWGQLVALASSEIFWALRLEGAPLLARGYALVSLFLHIAPLWLILSAPRRWSEQVQQLVPAGRKGALRRALWSALVSPVLSLRSTLVELRMRLKERRERTDAS